MTLQALFKSPIKERSTDLIALRYPIADLPKIVLDLS
jgi:hypothetical protein